MLGSSWMLYGFSSLLLMFMDRKSDCTGSSASRIVPLPVPAAKLFPVSDGWQHFESHLPGVGLSGIYMNHEFGRTTQNCLMFN
jgi:predicted metalloenzyme YecM